MYLTDGNIPQPYLQAHCQSPTSQRSNQSFVKELAKPTQEKLFLKKIMPARKWHIWLCPTHKPTLRKAKRATF